MADYSDYLKQAFDLEDEYILLNPEQCRTTMLELAPDFRSKTELLYMALQSGVGRKALALVQDGHVINANEKENMVSYIMSNSHIQMSQQDAKVIVGCVCEALNSVISAAPANTVAKNKKASFEEIDPVSENENQDTDTKTGQPANQQASPKEESQRNAKRSNENVLIAVFAVCTLVGPLIWDISCLIALVNKGIDTYPLLSSYLPVIVAFPSIPLLIARILYSKSGPRQANFCLIYAISFLSNFLYLLIPFSWFIRNEYSVVGFFHAAFGMDFLSELLLGAIFCGINYCIMKFLRLGTVMRDEEWNYFFYYYC